MITDLITANLRSRVGCHCWGTNPVSIDSVPTFAAVGCRWVRATRPMQMDTISTAPGQYDFAKGGERSIDLAVANGMSVMGILDARWGNETLFNDLPYASPIWEHLDLWEDFVAACVNRYKDRVNYWEIINEPPFFWWYPTPEGVRMPQTNPDMKRAPIWAYAELLKASARVIHELDPQAKVVMGSGFSDGLFLKRLYELGCKDAFDIASVHYLTCKHPADFARAYGRVRQVMAEFGDADKPLWDTENGPGGAVIGLAVQTADEYEALYNIYRHCFAYEYGLDRYFWFNPVSAKIESVGHASNTHGPDGSLSPAYQAMKTLTDQVGDGGLLAVAHPEGETHLYVFDGVDGPVSILWATAPATARLSGKFDAITALGERRELADAFPLTGMPLFIPGDISQSLDVTLHGKRETVVPPMKQVPEEVREFTCLRVEGQPGIDDPVWATLPYAAINTPALKQNDHFCLVTSSVPADVKMAYDSKALYLYVKTYDDQVNPSRPTGLVQFSLRDENPEVTEWAYFYNGYGLFNLYASPRGPMFLRYEHIFPDEYPSGRIEDAQVTVRPESDGLLMWARIPWAEIGPCHPGQHEPFLLMFTFNRADNILDVPDTDSPEEWSHNFADNFIVKPPALACNVRFE